MSRSVSRRPRASLAVASALTATPIASNRSVAMFRSSDRGGAVERVPVGSEAGPIDLGGELRAPREGRVRPVDDGDALRELRRDGRVGRDVPGGIVLASGERQPCQPTGSTMDHLPDHDGGDRHQDHERGVEEHVGRERAHPAQRPGGRRGLGQRAEDERGHDHEPDHGTSAGRVRPGAASARG